MNNHRLAQTEKYLLTLWFIANLVIGLFIVRDFGISYDEPNYYLYAQSSLDAYRSMFGLAYTPAFGLYPNYGPAFIIFPELVIRLLKWILPNISAVDIWHYSYFLLFQISALCLYSLARRWFKIWSAWGVLLLYTFQPILWGHAFINPKDIPFMAFCLFTIWSGFRLADSLGAQNRYVHLQPIFKKLWLSIEAGKRQRFVKLARFEAYALLVIMLLIFPLNRLVEKLVTTLYVSDPASLQGKWFHTIASKGSEIPLESYIYKAQILLFRIEFTTLLLGALILFSYFIGLSILAPNHAGPKTVRTDQASQAFHFAWKEVISLLRSPKLILAGALLGMTISVRVLGPLPGLIVTLYLVFTLRQKSLPVILAYAFYAVLSAFLTWPYLWSAPIAHFTESVVVMSNFPWSGRVLFNGQYYPAENLPISYLPVLLNIQLTETLLLLIYIGLIVLIWSLIYKPVGLDLLLVIGLGALFPLAGLIISRASMYDNFRQVLFIIPPLLLLAGLALDIFFSLLKAPVIRLLLLLALAFPGFYAIARLHPYEYIYYNIFVGGIHGAEGGFELDYWRIALRDLTLGLNEIAGPHSRIVTSSSPASILPYIRSDFILEKFGDDPEAVQGGYDYAILPERYNADRLYPHGKILLLVEREGVVLGVVKAVKGTTSR